MPPSLTCPNVRYCSLRQPQTHRQRPLRLGRRSNFGHLHRCQLGSGVALAQRRAPMLHTIHVILSPRTPAKITQPVVRRISVQVPSFAALRTQPHERLQHQPMHREHTPPKIHNRVTLRKKHRTFTKPTTPATPGIPRRALLRETAPHAAIRPNTIPRHEGVDFERRHTHNMHRRPIERKYPRPRAEPTSRTS